MLPPKQKSSPARQALLQAFAALTPVNRDSVLAFAQFLLARQGTDESAPHALPREPLVIPRPTEETVVAAIRRLAQTYPMLNKDDLLHQSSSLMGGHMLQGHPARDVIDELETLFAAAYDRYAAGESD